MNAVVNSTHRLAEGWQQEAGRRRAMSAHDVTADILEHCAATLLSTVDRAGIDDEELSPADFGALPHVGKSASQVRRWCQFNQIPCRRVGRDYRIRRGTPVPAFTASVA